MLAEASVNMMDVIINVGMQFKFSDMIFVV